MPNTSFEYSVFEAVDAFNQSENAVDKPINFEKGKISLDGRYIQDGYIYKSNTKRILKQHYLKLREIVNQSRLRNLVKHSKKSDSISELCYDGILNKWKLCIPYSADKTKKQNIKRSAIALDPGVRSFLTWYDGHSIGEIGRNMWKHLKKLDSVKDQIRSKLQKTKNKHKIKRLRKAFRRLSNKIKNKVKYMHYKAINLLTRYKYVFLPEFKVSSIVKKLDKRSRRPLLNLSHFQFKVRLIQKASETGTKVIICNEAYTSKTCSNCGTQNKKLGASKQFFCSKCYFRADRDVNAARNIMMRVLSHSLRFKIVNSGNQTNHNLRGGSTSSNDRTSKVEIVPDHIKIKKDLELINISTETLNSKSEQSTNGLLNFD